MRGDHDIPRTGLSTEFDHNRDDYHRGHGLHCHVVSGRTRIASVNLETLAVTSGSLDGKEGRLAMEWIRNNVYTLKEDARYWAENGAIWQ
jgi:hypothetical protein